MIGFTEYGFHWLRIGSSVGLYFNSITASFSAKSGNFVDQLNDKYFSIFCYFSFGMKGEKPQRNHSVLFGSISYRYRLTHTMPDRECP
jgi:hypothetical protein